MDYCINCGADLTDEMENCPECGAARLGRRPSPFNPSLINQLVKEQEEKPAQEIDYLPQEPQEEILRDQPAPVSSGHEPGEPVVIDAALEDVSVVSEELPPITEPEPVDFLSMQKADVQDEVYDDPAYDVLNTGQYLATVLVMGIPVIGWLAVLIWALGGTKNFNRRNLARGVLLAFLIVVGIVAIAGFVLSYFMNDTYTMITEKLFAIIDLFK